MVRESLLRERFQDQAAHHARKAADEPKTEGTARCLESQIDEILTHFVPETNFPAYLALEQQGLFMLGYHQQRHFLWMTKDDRAAWAARWQTTPTQAA